MTSPASQFPWATSGPSPEARTALGLVRDESKEIPDCYSGTAWRLAYRIHKACGFNALPLVMSMEVLAVPAAELVQVIDLEGLEHASAFQFGWARNAMRQMHGLPPGIAPAVVSPGRPEQVLPAFGPALYDVRRFAGLGMTGEGRYYLLAGDARKVCALRWPDSTAAA